jgi:Protein of unknown function (DUF1449)
MSNLLLMISSFPTAIFTFVLGIAVLYWIFALFGFVEIDALDVDIPELDGQMSLNAQGDHTFAEMFSGLLMKLGLNGVPLTIVISCIALAGWMISYYISLFSVTLFGHGWIRYITGIPIFFASLYAAMLITAQVIKPLRKFFAKAEQQIQKVILGQTAVVRSSRVDQDFGEAFLDDGGAGLILKVRTIGGTQFHHGDKVVLLEYDANKNSYRVISEEDFLGKDIN